MLLLLALPKVPRRRPKVNLKCYKFVSHWLYMAYCKNVMLQFNMLVLKRIHFLKDVQRR